MPKSQRFILDRMRICGHILCERLFSVMLICWKKAGWVLKLELLRTVGDFWKKSISPVLLSLTSPLKRENSLAQASVKWKFVTDVPDIFGLFLSSSRFCFHACRLQFVYHATNYALNKLELASCFRAALWHS